MFGSLAVICLLALTRPLHHGKSHVNRWMMNEEEILKDFPAHIMIGCHAISCIWRLDTPTSCPACTTDNNIIIIHWLA